MLFLLLLRVVNRDVTTASRYSRGHVFIDDEGSGGDGHVVRGEQIHVWA